ncbi:hypothetical protein GCM10009557_79800 [Virgisporangium ochraceum]|uniref:Uncharacterized protein n=1 Tax=Virgisporangium ochraceum TaxID=65505 RepID=A0A8J3ZXG7_9ACTN|nr:hypothetical protein Voc01_056340 [Virgisporangium ochraceum]
MGPPERVGADAVVTGLRALRGGGDLGTALAELDADIDGAPSPDPEHGVTPWFPQSV